MGTGKILNWVKDKKLRKEEEEEAETKVNDKKVEEVKVSIFKKQEDTEKLEKSETVESDWECSSSNNNKSISYEKKRVKNNTFSSSTGNSEDAELSQNERRNNQV